MLAAAATAVPGAPKEVAAKKYVKSDKAKGRAARINTIKSKGYALWEKLLALFPQLEKWTDKNYEKSEWEQDITSIFNVCKDYKRMHESAAGTDPTSAPPASPRGLIQN